MNKCGGGGLHRRILQVNSAEKRERTKAIKGRERERERERERVRERVRERGRERERNREREKKKHPTTTTKSKQNKSAFMINLFTLRNFHSAVIPQQNSAGTLNWPQRLASFNHARPWLQLVECYLTVTVLSLLILTTDLIG